MNHSVATGIHSQVQSKPTTVKTMVYGKAIYIILKYGSLIKAAIGEVNKNKNAA